MRAAGSETRTHVLTEGGLVRTLKVGRPEHTMHLRWTGHFAAGKREPPDGPGHAAGEPEEFLVEIELLKIVGDSAVVRLWAPEEVMILSAKKDPQCQAALQ